MDVDSGLDPKEVRGLNSAAAALSPEADSVVWMAF